MSLQPSYVQVRVRTWAATTRSYGCSSAAPLVLSAAVSGPALHAAAALRLPEPVLTPLAAALLTAGRHEPARHLAALHSVADGSLCALAAMLGGSVDLVRDITQRCASGATPLFLAAAAGDTSILTMLIQAHADADAAENGHRPLHVAAAGGHLDAVSGLLEADAVVNAPVTDGDDAGFTPLFYAALGAHAAVVDALLDHGTDVQPIRSR